VIALLNRRLSSDRKENQEDDEKESAESLAGVQGEGGDCSHQGQHDIRGDGAQ
jgi:hypothetical protein